MGKQDQDENSCEIDEVHSYGWFGFTPTCLQVINTAGWVLFFFSLGNGFQSGVVNGLLGVVLTTVEKRFELSSSQSSWIASAYELGTIPALVAFSYIGSRIHRPRLVAAGFLLCGTGCVLFALPHFLTSVYDPDGGDDSEDRLCKDRTNDTSICDDDDNGSGTSLSNYIWFFIIARFLHGIGVTPLYNWGVTFLDDCVSKDTFSFYIGIFYAMGLIGPAIAIIVGGYMLTIFTDFYNVDEVDITPSDQSWIGAWWLGFLIFGCGCYFFSLPISGYPKDLPGAEEIRQEKKSEAYKSQDIDDEMDIAGGDMKLTLKELPYYLKILATNPTYVFLCFYVSCDSLIIAGFAAFGPKFVQNQYGLTASLAGSLFGMVLLPAGTLGTILGGWIIKRRQMECKEITKWQMLQTIVTLLLAFILFLYCDSVDFAGVTVPYTNTSSGIDLKDECNVQCMCDDVPYSPVCGTQNLQYFSPCHAGCEYYYEEDDQPFYHNCSCILPYSDEYPQAAEGQCTAASCIYVPIFFIVFFFEVFMFFSCSTMNISATIRCVPAQQRSLAIGIQWLTLRILGTVPGPVLFGLAFDGACQLWSESCGERGACIFYDNFEVGLYLFSICFGVKGASLIFIFVAWIVYKPPASSTDKIADINVNNAYVKDETEGVLKQSSETPISNIISTTRM